MKLRRIIGLGTVLAVGGILYGGHQNHADQKVNVPSAMTAGKTTKVSDTGSVNDKVPGQNLATSVLTDGVKNQLLDGQKSIEYNGHGAFIINNNQTDLDANVTSAPYVSLSTVDSLGRAGMANALVNKSSRQYKDRRTTGNAKTIKPVGWKQKRINGSEVLCNRGHLIAYAIAGNVKGFDASEANEANIVTQTAWSNQASNGDDQNTGQNYYETLVRRTLDSKPGVRVRYRVTPVYDGQNLVPSGVHMEAKSSDGSLMYNVFVPNVQPGVVIDYHDGASQVN